MDFFNELFSCLSKEAMASEDFIVDIAIALRRMRIALGYSQEEAAEKCNVSQAMISKYESGDYNPSVRSLWDYVVALGGKISVDISCTTMKALKNGMVVKNRIVCNSAGLFCCHNLRAGRSRT